MLKKPEFKDFELFLQLAEVFGGGYQDDVDHGKFNLRNTETHCESMINYLERLIEAYDMTLSSLEQQKTESALIGNLVTHHEEFTRLI